MARGDVDLVTFHHAGQDFGWACRQDAGAQLFGHGLHITDIEIEFAGDLLVGQVQAHEVQAQDPDPQRLMMTGEDGVGQVIEARLAGRAAVALALSLPIVVTVPRHLVTPALRAPHTLGPAEPSDRIKALGVVDQELEVDQGIHHGLFLPADNGEHPRS